MMKISKNRLKKCWIRNQAGKPDEAVRVRRRDRSGIPGDEMLHRRFGAQTLRDSDRDDQQQKPDRQQPEQVEPSVAANPDARSDTVHVRDRAGPRRLVDHVLARSKLPAVATDTSGEMLDCAGEGLSFGVGAVGSPTFRSLRRAQTP